MGNKTYRLSPNGLGFDSRYNNMVDWLIANTLGKDRKRIDAMAYNTAMQGDLVVFHPESDGIKNVSESDYTLYYSPDDSINGMTLNYEKLTKGAYMSLRSYREFKCGTALAASAMVVANLGNPVTAQTITLTVTNGSYYMVTIPTKKDSTITISGANIINNTNTVFPAGVTSILIKATSNSAVITLTAALGVGLTTGNSTEIKCYPNTAWTSNELAIISCSD